jgi:hypothetical protein
MEAQRLWQEERVRKALERAQAPVKKKVHQLLLYTIGNAHEKIRKIINIR